MTKAQVDRSLEVVTILIDLGLTTVEKVREHFSHQVTDEKKLATIMTEVDRRLARRA